MSQYFEKSSHVIGLGLTKALNDALDQVLPNFTAAASVGPETPTWTEACVLVGADAFDPEAVTRTQAARAHFAQAGLVALIAITSFAPGSYRDFIRLNGADDCILESDVLDTL
ncbi:hypothetical protein [Tropicibacter sp. S64]|uniref:hypothetical protein n=1 Tax=Tropicibacter sp. S64 TaxID=3415122 RepID=UPI003C7CDA55